MSTPYTSTLIAFRDLIVAAESAGLEGPALDAARTAFYAETHPDDIDLPDFCTWEWVDAQREKHNLDPWMVPVAAAPGAIAWITITAAREDSR